MYKNSFEIVYSLSGLEETKDFPSQAGRFLHILSSSGLSFAQESRTVLNRPADLVACFGLVQVENCKCKFCSCHIQRTHLYPIMTWKNNLVSSAANSIVKLLNLQTNLKRKANYWRRLKTQNDFLDFSQSKCKETSSDEGDEVHSWLPFVLFHSWIELW